MMLKKLSFFSGALLLLVIAFSSCQNQVAGCTDPDALNYNSNATQDDGTCQYSNNNNNTNNEAGITFWFSQYTADKYIGYDSILSFKFIVDGVVEGIHSLYVTDSVAPPCNAANHVTVKRTVPQGTIEFHPYFMVTQTGDTIITGQFQFLGGSCYAVEFTY
jgi:hypothetical protein